MGRILVIGTGPGNEKYLTPVARVALEKAQAVAGGSRALMLVSREKRKFQIKNNLHELESFVRENMDKTVAVLTSGDPGIFSILKFLLEKFDRDEIEVIPGISSLQLCFAKFRETWEDVRLISLHGRNYENISSVVRNNRKVAIFTDSRNSPQKVAEKLLKELGNLKAGVCCNLTSEDEIILISNLMEIASGNFPENSIVVVWSE